MPCLRVLRCVLGVAFRMTVFFNFANFATFPMLSAFWGGSCLPSLRGSPTVVFQSGSADEFLRYVVRGLIRLLATPRLQKRAVGLLETNMPICNSYLPCKRHWVVQSHLECTCSLMQCLTPAHLFHAMSCFFATGW